MRVLSQLLLLSGLLTAACGPAATSKTEKPAPSAATARAPTSPAVQPAPAPKAPALAAAPVDNLAQTAVPLVADSMRAYWGSRPMRFATLTTTQLTDLGIDAGPYLGRRVWAAQDLYELPRFYYHPSADTSQWVMVRLEDVGEWGAGRDWTLDSVDLGPGQPLGLLITVDGHQGFWGGAVETRVMELLALDPQPRLLFKSETRCTNISYGRQSEEDYDEDASGELRREQTISVHNGLVVVGPVELVDRSGSEQQDSILRTVPMTMVPPGQYRYQGGRLVRIGR